jgi:hypothetical protein
MIEGIRTGDKQAALRSVEALQVADKILHVKNREYEEKERGDIKSDGYVVSTLEAAMWATCKHEFLAHETVGYGTGISGSVVVVGILNDRSDLMAPSSILFLACVVTGNLSLSSDCSR